MDQPKKAKRNDQWCNRACIRRPPHGVLKCNYGAAYNLNNQQVQCGWIVQDSYGVAKLWGSIYASRFSFGSRGNVPPLHNAINMEY